MKFIPYSSVISNHRLYKGGVEYDVSPKEAKELGDYGTVLEIEPEDNEVRVEKTAVAKPKSTPKKKGNKKS